MSFFNDDFYKALDKNINSEKKTDSDAFSDIEDDDNELIEEPEQNTETQDINENIEDQSYYPDNINLDVNKKNEEEFKNLMDNASYKTDDYWDFNSPIIKIILGILLIIIIGGVLYYVISWFSLAN